MGVVALVRVCVYACMRVCVSEYMLETSTHFHLCASTAKNGNNDRLIATISNLIQHYHLILISLIYYGVTLCRTLYHILTCYIHC